MMSKQISANYMMTSVEEESIHLPRFAERIRHPNKLIDARSLTILSKKSFSSRRLLRSAQTSGFIRRTCASNERNLRIFFDWEECWKYLEHSTAQYSSLERRELTDLPVNIDLRKNMSSRKLAATSCDVTWVRAVYRRWNIFLMKWNWWIWKIIILDLWS